MENKKFIGDTFPGDSQEHMKTFEDIFDELHNEMDNNERYISEIKSDQEKDNIFLGELIELVSKGETNPEYYDTINKVKDSIVASGNLLLEVHREQNKISDYIQTLREIRDERDNKLTTLKEGQQN